MFVVSHVVSYDFNPDLKKKTKKSRKTKPFLDNYGE